ncbi:hypothetical protein [Pseudonocardia asaccharolytica]|uniref:Uncharacterized protein n=1 Tax=Pseudonocardia asaccharolytica DSM 44247 = NBRC 16224 TaxID=1123024 RepID=A0A511CYT9_9PSEU|nr:hypothetical protein [Pseudonocardia asaccharolytica]GEL17696.1 hypothetical protein PA7_15330 [Pseudonocardia asaccharolytica DSM 44247 = NBRC 16224]
MGTLINLVENPACKVNAAGWFGEAGWGRTTSAHASLPRTTGFAGTAAGDVICANQIPIVADSYYVGSVHIRAVAASTVTVGFDWYDDSSYLSSSSFVPYTLSAGSTTRVNTGVGAGAAVPPAGATRAVLVVAGGDGEAQYTASMITLGSTLHDYFDGDSPRATWEGTPGNSRSYLITGDDSWGWADSGDQTATQPGPTGQDTATWGETGAATGSGTRDDPISWGESGLIVASGYDDDHGRIRVEAIGFPAGTICAVVYSRPAGSTVWTQVRGGKVSVSGGRMARPVDDYEYTAGVPMTYRIVGLSSPEGAADVVTATAQVIRSGDPAHAWIKFIAAPYLNRKITLTGWSPITRAARNATYDVKGRIPPVVVTDVHSSRRVEIQVRTGDIDDTERLDAALSQGHPIFLHTCSGTPLPSMYAAVGEYEWAPPTPRSAAAQWRIPLTEVTAPPPSVVGASTTWETVLAQYGTWQELLDAAGTWQEIQ